MNPVGRTVELTVLCEGPTERNFVRGVLGVHLASFGVFAKSQALVPNSRGGVVPFETLRGAIKREMGRLRDHQHVTTMVDLYAIGAFPGAPKRRDESGSECALRIEREMTAKLSSAQFHPYVQVHEFEALVFVDLDELEREFPDGDAAGAAQLLRSRIGALAPEDIDDGATTAPSKRIIGAVNAYADRKASAGPNITARIGLPRLRAACPHFDSWITRLEKLAPNAR
jgi:hypothetical protein